jgi:hypothetical protein
LEIYEVPNWAVSGLFLICIGFGAADPGIEVVVKNLFQLYKLGTVRMIFRAF